MNSLIEWFNAYPSRVIVIEWLVIMILYLILLNCKRRKKCAKKRFVFCSGRKSNILYVDLVSDDVFNNYQQYVEYGVIDMNNSSIYFDVRH